MRKIRILLLLLVVGYLLYLGGRVGYVYFERWTVEEFLERVAQNAVHPVHRETVRAYINAQVRDQGFPFTPEEVLLEESVDGSVTARVFYTRDVPLLPPNPYLSVDPLHFEFDLRATARSQPSR